MRLLIPLLALIALSQCFDIILFNKLNKAITVRHSFNGGDDINIKIPKKKANGTPSNYTLTGASPDNTYTFAMLNLFAQINPEPPGWNPLWPALDVTAGYLAIGTTLVTTHMDVMGKILQCNDAAFPHQCIQPGWDETPSASKTILFGDPYIEQNFEIWFFA